MKSLPRSTARGNEGARGRSTGVAGVQEYRSSGVQEFRSSGVQEFRSSFGAKKKAPQKARIFAQAKRHSSILTPEF